MQRPRNEQKEKHTSEDMKNTIAQTRSDDENEVRKKKIGSGEHGAAWMCFINAQRSALMPYNDVHCSNIIQFNSISFDFFSCFMRLFFLILLPICRYLDAGQVGALLECMQVLH